MTENHQRQGRHPQSGRYQRLPAQQSIRVFEAAARHMSFTQAGLELSITQSGVSKQIKGLEAFLGVSLFIRDGHQLYLTEAGRRFHTHCTQALDSLQLAVNEIRGSQGRIRLQAPPTFAARWLIPRMDRLRQHLPDLELHIETTWMRTINDHILAEGGELVIHACRHYPFQELHQTLLRREVLAVLVSPDYIARHGAIKKPEDLLNKDLIHTRIDGHIHWQAWANIMQFPQLDITSGYEFETLDMALSAAENGIGVVVCDLIYALEALKNGSLIIPFQMPLMQGLSYVLLSQSALSHTSNSQQQYQRWLMEQIKRDHQALAEQLILLGFNPAQLVEAFDN